MWKVRSEGHLSSFTASFAFSNLISNFADLVFSGPGGKVAVCAHRYSGEFGNLTSERALDGGM